jgi:hypothetical protein
MKLSSGLFAIALLTQAASASIITQADFGESLDLPAFGTGPRVLSRTGVALPDSGIVLDGSDEVSNPEGWAGVLELSFDSTTNVLSVTADAENQFQIVSITLSNLVFSDGTTITGITPLVTGNAATSFTATPILSTSFTGNSATITYQVPDLAAFDLFNVEPMTDQFQLTLSDASSLSTAPEPGTILLAGLTLVGLGIARRRFVR